ncbi:MAG: hypothetical protein VR73_08650 [Gammaproteobacteria bacterium BRH_c0]|nr:MAG: hypothetical protein VR73_08650 [Gammaproteobacteria bacterium BRH_c0]
MVILASTIAAIALYLSATLWHVRLRLKTPAAETARPTWLLLTGSLGLLCHGLVAYKLVFSGAGINLSLWPVSVLILFVVNLIVLASSVRKPVHSLLVLLFPAAALGLLLALLFNPAIPHSEHLAPGIGIHVLFSLLSYSLFTIAAVQSLLLAYQHYQLKHHHPGGLLYGLPPLQTMEALLFEVIWSGFILLTLGLVSGFVFVENFWAQHLAHKTFFSLIAWLLFAILLWGRHRLGWRGNIAMRWTLGGFASLALAYWGSKFVLEVILGLGT